VATVNPPIPSPICNHTEARLFQHGLFRAAAETLATIAADPRHLGAQLGMTMVLHTWGQGAGRIFSATLFCDLYEPSLEAGFVQRYLPLADVVDMKPGRRDSAASNIIVRTIACGA
jgi:hypothetical protein